jgi:NAD(P)-dependent dehydrogenase (short-subunit alcohol dehydrogenase family)
MSESVNDLFRLDGRVAFVSGAGGHLGSVMARALLDAGSEVIVNGRNAARLAEFADTLRGLDRKVRCAAFDVGDIGAVRRFFAAESRLDILVNNAIDMTPTPFDKVSPDDFESTYRSSVIAAFEAVRAALPALRQGASACGQASVVNIASMYANVSPDRRIYTNPEQASPAHYGAAKAALLQLTRHLAAELGPSRIRVNALVPGPFPRHGIRSDDPAFAGRLAERTMLARLGDAREIAGPLLFLASRASSYMTGNSLVIDGGWTAW